MNRTVAIRAVVGLGNPGSAYTASRHNIGFRTVEAIAEKYSCFEKGDGSDSTTILQKILRFFSSGRAEASGSWLPEATGSSCTVSLSRRDVLLFRPGLFMNRSGEALKVFLDSHQLEIHEILVLVDDIDLPFGRIRLRPSGGPGSHNGLKDICDLFSRDFPRLRFGIRGEENWDNLADYVLSPFSPGEEAMLPSRISLAVQAVVLAVEDGMTVAMNRFNSL